MNTEKKSNYRPVMVTNSFYEKLEIIRISLGFRTLSRTFEYIADKYLEEKNNNNKND